MTRNFSNQRRDDMRPTSRNTSSGNHREEQSSRPARPRLSRDAVDRAWENGATRKYADYRPRQNASTPSNQRQGRPSPAFERSQPPYERRTYGSRQEGYGAPSPSFNRSGYPPQRDRRPEAGPRRFNENDRRPETGPRRFNENDRRPEAGPRRFNENDRRPEAGPRRFNEPGNRAPGNRPGLNSERWTRNDAPQRQGYRDRYQDERPPRFSRYGSDAPERQGYRTENNPRSFDRPDRGRENFTRGPRPGAPQPQRDNYNPRWQSRPGAQREEYRGPRREYPDISRERPPFRQERPYGQPGGAQFEGDYEHFETREHADQSEQTNEKHVTRLPDGRVLKGSRPAQRKQARFWNEVEQETTNLIPPATAIPDQQETPPATHEVPVAQPTRPARPRKQPAGPRKVKTVKTVRTGDAGPRSGKAKVSKKKARDPQKPVARPSQRGYKWPTPGE